MIIIYKYIYIYYSITIIQSHHLLSIQKNIVKQQQQKTEIIFFVKKGRGQQNWTKILSFLFIAYKIQTKYH